jgi:hypothetical protein
VGASLLAMAICHSTSALTDPPQSRAGSLPQGSAVTGHFQPTTDLLWEQSLSETLASANATLSDLAFELDGSRRHVALGVQQLIELSELLANRVLDERVPVAVD